jgi:two-component sensor histidine kinase
MAAAMQMQQTLPHPIEWRYKLRHFVLILAFALVVAGVQMAFQPDTPFKPNLTYSLLISLCCWLLIDFGRHALPSSAETGWPRGVQGLLLVVGGLVIGYLVGSSLADRVCLAMGWYAQSHLNSHNHWRNTILTSALAGLVGSYYFYAQSRSSYFERKMAEAQRHASEARLKLLETQLEPHMLFNTLANLRALIAVDPARAQQMLDHMIAYLRATLDASRTTTHSLQEEFDRVRDYLELMAIRMGPRLAFTLDLPPELAAARVPALLLQPLVENSIQHGLEPKVQGGRIDVRALRQGGELVLEVQDTGVGEAAGSSARNGFGLAQVRERLASLHGERASITFARDGGGAHTRIALPAA